MPSTGKQNGDPEQIRIHKSFPQNELEITAQQE